jgi:hypothetical protein
MPHVHKKKKKNKLGSSFPQLNSFNSSIEKTKIQQGGNKLQTVTH